MALSKSTCTWKTPLETVGIKARDGFSVFASDTTGDRFTGHGTHVMTMDNGDKVYIRLQSGGTTKDGVVLTDSGKWTYTGGTGQMKGIKGSGTYKGKGDPDGSTTYEVAGTYRLGK